MEIKYKNTLNDYIEYINIYCNLNLKERLIKILQISALPIGCLFIILYNIRKYKAINTLLMFTIIGLIIISTLWIIFIPKFINFYNKRSIKKLVKNNPEMLLEKQINIENKSISLLTSSGSKCINISEIRNIIDKKDNIYIFENKNIIYAIIPTKFFKSNEEKLKFLSLLNQK